MIDPTRLVLGVDGGGSKTSVWLGQLVSDSSMDPAVLGKATGGPGNVRSHGFDVALRNVQAAIADAFADAGLQPISVAAACISLAGAGRVEEQTQISEWARRMAVAECVRVVGDAQIILAGAAMPNNSRAERMVGISLIAGTGSMAWGQNRDQEHARCGGWGYLFGDEGSAYALGRQALQLASQTADGRHTAQQLCQRLLNHLGLEQPEQLIEWCYTSQSPRQTIASLAPFVFSISQQELCADDVVRDGARALARMVSTVARKLKFVSGNYLLACAGSVLVHQPAYVGYILSELAYTGLAPAKHQLVREPVCGAMRLAAHELHDRESS